MLHLTSPVLHGVRLDTAPGAIVSAMMLLLCYTEHGGENVVARPLPTPPTGGTENGSPGFGLSSDYVSTFF